MVLRHHGDFPALLNISFPRDDSRKPSLFREPGEILIGSDQQERIFRLDDFFGLRHSETFASLLQTVFPLGACGAPDSHQIHAVFNPQIEISQSLASKAAGSMKLNQSESFAQINKVLKERICEFPCQLPPGF